MQILWPLFPFSFFLYYNKWLSSWDWKNKLGVCFQSMKYCCCYCKYSQDETKNSCTVFLLSLSATEGESGWKEKGGIKISQTELKTTLPGNTIGFVFLSFFLYHAFSGAPFPVGSALEVAPASVSLIFTDRTMHQASGGVMMMSQSGPLAVCGAGLVQTQGQTGAH